MRNLLIHVYWRTEAEEARKTAQQDLPGLQSALQQLLNEPPETDTTDPPAS